MANPPEGSPEWAAQDKGPYTIAICWAVTAFSTLFVIARLYVRGKIMGKLQSDDWFTVAAQVSAPAQSEYRPSPLLACLCDLCTCIGWMVMLSVLLSR